MNYLHPEFSIGDQSDRVISLCKEAAANSNYIRDVQAGSPVTSEDYWTHLLNRINDEIENMC
jgi:hypothetical protein